jgi:hypothetical protein
MVHTRNQLACLWTTVICLGLAGVGFFGVSGYVPPPHASLSADELADFYASHHDRIRIGMLITLISWVGWATLVAVISTQLARIETGTKVLTILQAICGTLGWVILTIASLVLEAAAYRPKRDPQITQALHDVGWIIAFMPAVIFIGQAVCIAAVILQDHSPAPLMRRWLAYVNIWCALLFVPGLALIMFTTGPLAYHGLLVFWIPFLVFGGWILALCWELRRAVLLPDVQQPIPIPPETPMVSPVR